MTTPTKIGLLIVATAGLVSLGLWGVQGVRAETTNTADTPVAATTVSTTFPGRGPGRHLDEMASQLGMTTTELQTQLDSGKQFYQIAAEHGLTYAKLKANKLAEVKTRLDDMVKTGFMTQAEADTAYQQVQTESSQNMMGGGGLGFGRGRHGM